MTRQFSEEEVVALARRAYRQGTAEIRLVPERTVLLVIDMQDELVRPGWTPYWVPEATRRVPQLARLVAACRARGVPVVSTLFSATHRYLDRPAAGAAMPSRYPELGAPTRPGSATGVSGRRWRPSRPRSSSTSRPTAPSTTRRWRRSRATSAATP
jgi:Isochorismatase family